MVTDTLSTLVASAQQGDFTAFGHIVERFRGMAYTTAYHMLHDAQLVEDATQEAFIEAYLNLSHLRTREAFPGWFRCIVIKQSDRLTRRKQINMVPLEGNTTHDFIQEDLNPALVFERNETRSLVTEAVYQLNEHERTAIELYYGGGYEQKDIASYLEVPLSTVKKRLFDGRKHLKAHLDHLVQDALREQTASQMDRFSDRLQLLIAIRTGKHDTVSTLIEHNPFLVNDDLGSKVIPLSDLRRYVPGVPFVWSALHEAINSSHVGIMTLLLERGANPNAQTAEGNTPLHEAALMQQTEAIKILLTYGARCDSISKAGLTALHHAIMRNSPALVELLLTHGAQTNIAGGSPKTPLHWAAIKGYTHIASLLLSHGADPDARDDLGRTALDWANARYHMDIVTFLQQPRAKNSSSR